MCGAVRCGAVRWRAEAGLIGVAISFDDERSVKG